MLSQLFKIFKRSKCPPNDGQEILNSGEIVDIEQIIKARDLDQQQNREYILQGWEIVKGIDLRPGDVIIHKYSSFTITNCGCGFGAGNEFGQYYWINGYYGVGTEPHKDLLENFWTFQRCPVIRAIKNK